MKGSFVFPGNENENNSSSHEFDLQTDFSQFLEEAKRHANHDKENPRAENQQKEQVLINQDAKKGKKSWKNVLFPFWRSKSDKSKKHSKETSRKVIAVTNPNPPRGHVSGPIYGTRGAAAASSGRYRHRLLFSGPLTGLFQPKKREESEIPYVSLDKLNKPTNDSTVYGPLYLVS